MMAEKIEEKKDTPAEEVIQTYQMSANAWAIKNPPADKSLKWVSQVTYDRALGNYYHWEIYTPQMYREDQAKYGTQLSAIAQIDDREPRIRCKLHWLIWLPKKVREAEIKARTEILETIKGEIPQGASGTIQAVQGGQVIRSKIVKAPPLTR